MIKPFGAPASQECCWPGHFETTSSVVSQKYLYITIIDKV